MILPIPILALAFLLATVLLGFEMYVDRVPVCPECPHCLARREAEARLQQRLQDEYARRIGLRDDDRDQPHHIG